MSFSRTKQNARMLGHSMMAQEAALNAQLGIHKIQIERTQARLDRVAALLGVAP